MCRPCWSYCLVNYPSGVVFYRLISILLIYLQASVPLLLKKINEDLDYLKKSLDIVRETPQFMANEFLARAIQKLEIYQFDEAKYPFLLCWLNTFFTGIKTF